MTNTKFRKRALLSSVAMLLVALVALGSATFAWFTSNPNATASGLSVKANSSLGLVIRSASEKDKNASHWSHDAKFRATNWNSSTEEFTYATDEVALDPASLDVKANDANNGKLFTATAANSGNYAPTGSYSGAEAGFFSEALEMKITGSSADTQVNLTHVSWTAGSGNLKDAVRVAILGTDGKVVAVFSNSSTTNDCATATGAVASNTESNGLTTTAKCANASANLATPISLGNFNQTAKAITVVVYLDGCDEAVFTDNIDDADLVGLISNLSFKFAAVTAA